MKYVQFFVLNDNAEAEKRGRVILKNGKVIYESIPPGLQDDLEGGVPIKGQVIMPADGLAFLEAIVRGYSRGSRLYTGPVEEE